MKFKRSRKLFAHIDCDSFFASCEIRANPSLKNKYVCVGSEIIVAATYNAKRKGIKVGTPIWQAREILGKGAVFLGGNFELYGEVSRLLMKYLQKKHTSCGKVFHGGSFLGNFMTPRTLQENNSGICTLASRGYEKKIGIPVSIGVSNTRIKAKIFSDLRKPYGVFVGGMQEPEYETFKKIAFKKIPFAGQKSQKRFLHRCRSIHDFLGLLFWQLKKEVGKSMTTLRLELHGVNAFYVRNNRSTKSISRSRSFNKNKTGNRDFLITQILGHFETVYSRMNEKSVEIKGLSLMFRDEDFQIHRLSFHFGEHTNEREKILSELKRLFGLLYSAHLIYRSTGVTFSEFRSYLPRQLNLFEQVSNPMSSLVRSAS